jgi:TolB protein
MRAPAVSAFALFAASACSSGGDRASGTPPPDAGPDATILVDGAAPSAGDGSVDASISTPPPLDDADTPASDASPGGPWVAFVSTRGGAFGIYLVHPDGTGLEPLAQGAGDDLHPAWSPDGTKVAFASNRSGSYLLYVIDVATRVTSPVATGLSYAIGATFAPDGGEVAFGGAVDGGDAIFRVPIGGGTPTQLTGPGNRDALPVWSPDGSRIYFASDRGGAFEVWSIAPDGTGLAQITTGSLIVGGPAISPDGKTLLFAQTVPGGGAGTDTQAVMYAVATKATTVLSPGDSSPSMSSSGARVAVTSPRFDATHPQIVLMDADGGAPFRLTNSAGIDDEAVFQPTP